MAKIVSKKLKGSLKAHGRASKKSLKRGLLLAGLFLQRESQKIVPIDTGVLRASANTRMDGDAAVTVSYGTDYAIYVHEDLEARHKPGKEAKFLEKPYKENRKKLRDIVKREMRRG